LSLCYSDGVEKNLPQLPDECGQGNAVTSQKPVNEGYLIPDCVHGKGYAEKGDSRYEMKNGSDQCKLENADGIGAARDGDGKYASERGADGNQDGGEGLGRMNVHAKREQQYRGQ